MSVRCRTYDFDPEMAREQICQWVDEYKPDLVIGESLGALHALRISNLPIILVSPALNAPFYLNILSRMTWIPGVTKLFNRIYKPKEGDRQQLNFNGATLRKYRSHGRAALDGLSSRTRPLHAFFGEFDHYRKSGVVSVRYWRRNLGDTFTLYPGTHFMEEEFISTCLIPKITEFLE